MAKAELLGVGKDWNSLRSLLQYMDLASDRCFREGSSQHTGMRGYIYARLIGPLLQMAHHLVLFLHLQRVFSSSIWNRQSFSCAGVLGVDRFLLSFWRRICIGLIIAFYACMPVEQ